MNPLHRPGRMRLRRPAVVAILAAVATSATVGAQPPDVRRKPIVDRAVVPAAAVACRQCGGVGCQLHGGHVAECRDGLCAPHCPVRPSQYGFYSTQWRRWPGQAAATAADAAATPAAPPASQVPNADEESPLPSPSVEPGPAVPDTEKPRPEKAGTDRVPRPGRQPAAGEPEKPLPTDPVPETPAADGAAESPEPPVARPAPPAESAPQPPTTPTPKPPADDAGLFDQSAVPTRGLVYPPHVGRSLASGATPWRLQATPAQRAAGSVRGL